MTLRVGAVDSQEGPQSEHEYHEDLPHWHQDTVPLVKIPLAIGSYIS